MPEKTISYAAILSDNPSPGNPYQELVRAALAKIWESDYPSGMLPWLREAEPALYEALTVSLPDEIHRLWASGAPAEGRASKSLLEQLGSLEAELQQAKARAESAKPGALRV